MTRPDKCPECGVDPFFTQDYPKLTKEMDQLEYHYKRVRAYHGEASAKWDIEKIKLEEGMRWLQRKTKKQAQAIQRLEAKLKKLGEQPYRENDE